MLVRKNILDYVHGWSWLCSWWWGKMLNQMWKEKQSVVFTKYLTMPDIVVAYRILLSTVKFPLHEYNILMCVSCYVIWPEVKNILVCSLTPSKKKKKKMPFDCGCIIFIFDLVNARQIYSAQRHLWHLKWVKKQDLATFLAVVAR